MADPVRASNSGLGQAILLYDADGRPMKTVQNIDGTSTLVVSGGGGGGGNVGILNVADTRINPATEETIAAIASKTGSSITFIAEVDNSAGSYYIDNSVARYEEILALAYDDQAVLSIFLFGGKNFGDGPQYKLPYTTEQGGNEYGRLYKTYLIADLWLNNLGGLTSTISVFGLKRSNQNRVITGTVGVLNNFGLKVNPATEETVNNNATWFKDRFNYQANYRKCRFDDAGPVRYYAYATNGVFFIEEVDGNNGTIKWTAVASVTTIDATWANRAGLVYDEVWNINLQF